MLAPCREPRLASAAADLIFIIVKEKVFVHGKKVKESLRFFVRVWNLPVAKKRSVIGGNLWTFSVK